MGSFSWFIRRNIFLLAWWDLHICGLEALGCSLSYVWGRSLVEALHSLGILKPREPCCCCGMNQCQWKLPCKAELHWDLFSSNLLVPCISISGVVRVFWVFGFFSDSYHRRLGLVACCLCSCHPAFCKSKESAFPSWSGRRAWTSTNTLTGQKWGCCAVFGCGTGIRGLAQSPLSWKPG